MFATKLGDRATKYYWDEGRPQDHPGKTKVVRIDAIQQEGVCLDQTYIDDVEESTYLGNVMSKSEGRDEDITARKKSPANV